MKQRGRSSSAMLATVTALPGRLLEAPDDLTPEQAEVWGRVAATKPGDWWDAGSAPLLAEYCRAKVEADRIAVLVEVMSRDVLSPDFDVITYKEVRKIQAGLSNQLTTLSTKMRLAQQSRYEPQRAATISNKVNAEKPWHRVIESQD